MKKNELTNKENTSFENGFGMNDEEMNQIVGGSSFMNESIFSAQLSSQAVSGPFNDVLYADSADWCFVCLTNFTSKSNDSKPSDNEA